MFLFELFVALKSQISNLKSQILIMLLLAPFGLSAAINLSYFPSRARLNFRWIFKEFDLKSNMKGFFENFLALSVKKLKKVLMILPSISGRGRAFPAESCRYMPCLAISNFYRRWNFHNNFQANCTGPYLFFGFVFFLIGTPK